MAHKLENMKLKYNTKDLPQFKLFPFSLRQLK